jgi:hypothetical protein
MSWKLFGAIVLSQGILAPIAGAGPCGIGTLASYIALGSGGCSVGTLAFTDFAFSTISSSGGAVAVTSTGITVTPVILGAKAGLNYASAGFSVTAGQSIQYLLAYTIDDPPIIHGFELEMFTDPPVFPGIAQIDSLSCVGAAFLGTSCSGTTRLNSVFDNGASASHLDTEFFGSPAITVGNRTTITLDATSGGSANFESFNELAIVPEPESFWLISSSLLLLLWPRRAPR